MSIEDFIKKHKPLNLYIEYNDHKTSYKTVEEYIEERDIKDEEIIDKEECIKNDTIYSVQHSKYRYFATILLFYWGLHLPPRHICQYPQHFRFVTE